MLQIATDPKATPARVHLPEAAFLFADIAGFTAYTDIHGDARAAELAWRLRLGVEEQLGCDAHVIKTLGDAVMVRIATSAAIAAGLRIVSRALPAAADPPVRVGIHCGPAIECDGDFIGAAVNLAAHAASLAGPGEVLVTADVAIAACRLRNVADPVLLHAVREGSGAKGGRLRVISDFPLRRRHRASEAFTTSREAAHVQL